ncbi:type II toxin-antitoxin system RelE/ParE family toxin [Candidatus Poribacteria bacterium]|nr:type II toxin-antitoxin system RelE/ParE family toxin [Candidatus Poribacteria bacterium]
MYSLQIMPQAIESMELLPGKQLRQIVMKIFSLQDNPRPPDCKKIGKGHRVDSGEYRIFYVIDDAKRLITIWVVGKRNDDEIYREARRRGFI